MSGYLQRLASNARSPGVVHPLVGSLYSRPESESLPPPIEEQAGSSKADSKVSVALESLSPDKEEQVVAQPAGQPQRYVYSPLIEESERRPVEPAITGPRSPRIGAAPPPMPQPEPLPEEPRPVAIRQLTPRLKPAQPDPAPFPEPAKAGRHDEARVSGDIQIHIGRIEVTAVPPPVPRPAAPPARKSINLGEYLKRGRGSSS